MSYANIDESGLGLLVSRATGAAVVETRFEWDVAGDPTDTVSIDEAVWNDWRLLPLLPEQGPHILTVVSSEALTNICGYLGFQATQLTVREWPVRTAIGFSCFKCQMKILLSATKVKLLMLSKIKSPTPSPLLITFTAASNKYLIHSAEAWMYCIIALCYTLKFAD